MAAAEVEDEGAEQAEFDDFAAVAGADLDTNSGSGSP